MPAEINMDQLPKSNNMLRVFLFVFGIIHALLPLLTLSCDFQQQGNHL